MNKGTKCIIKLSILAGYQWLMLIILATWEAEIGRIMFQAQPGQKDHEIPPLK
jgi:hypothetical protein